MLVLPNIPDLQRVILTGSDHPFAFAVERDGGNVARVALEGQDGIRLTTVDVVQAHMLVARCCEVLFVGRDAELVDLLL